MRCAQRQGAAGINGGEVGAGPIGLAALLTAQFYSPAEVIMTDLDDNRLDEPGDEGHRAYHSGNETGGHLRSVAGAAGGESERGSASGKKDEL